MPSGAREFLFIDKLKTDLVGMLFWTSGSCFMEIALKKEVPRKIQRGIVMGKNSFFGKGV